MQNAALYTAATIFTLVAIAHGVRLATDSQIVIAGTNVPEWVSIAGVVIAALLAIWMVTAARRA